MHVVRLPAKRKIQRRMYLPSERMVVNGVGLGEVDGFNIGKMFNRMFTFRKGSFKFGNIMGALGSGVSNLMTFGAASAFAPKTFSAHSSTMKKVGMGVAATAAAAGAYYGGSALLKTGAGTVLKSGVSSTGGLLKSAGTFVVKNASDILKTGAQLVGGGGGGGGQAGGMSQAEYAALQQQQAYIDQQRQIAAYNAAQQKAYEEQLRQEAQYGNNVPVGEQLTPTMYPTMGNPSGGYGPYAQDMQLTSPYTPLTDEELINAVDPATGLVTDPATGNKIDPGTGRIVQAGMLPQLSTTTWVMIGGVTLLGLYLMTPSKSAN